MKKLVYLISPGKINKKFYNSLNAVLSQGNVKFFQLRLKKIKANRFLKIAKKIKKITSKHKVKFIVNDNFNNREVHHHVFSKRLIFETMKFCGFEIINYLENNEDLVSLCKKKNY